MSIASELFPGRSRKARDEGPLPRLFEVTDLLDPEAPLALYSALRQERFPFLLESVEKSGDRARFSFVGASPAAVVTVTGRRFAIEICSRGRGLQEAFVERLAASAVIDGDDKSTISGEIGRGMDLFDLLRSALPAGSGPSKFGRQAFLGGGIGYLAYDLVAERIDRPKTSGAPDAKFGIFEESFVYDHLTGKVSIAVAPLLAGEDPEEIASGVARHLRDLDLQEPQAGDLDPISVEADPATPFEESVRKAKEEILAGEIFQVVLSRRTRVRLKNPDPVALYKRLREINPSPYTYIFEFEDHALVGASPETLFSLRDGIVTTNPIAGTCPRGGSPEEDDLLAAKMLADEKERAEHVMLVDLGRNDVRSVSKAGSIMVEDFMSVLRYSHVQHIETTVRGTLRDGCDSFDAARAIFPAGTLSGAPKIRAMEIIDDLEGRRRGIYGGGVGYFSADGSADFAIAIRSIVLEGDTAVVQAGAGIVADSDPHREFLETERKMAAMKRALGVVA
ncbi:anthranilate synthase component I [Methanotrichaceae archaeon Mx]|uniref:Anthranilate synthase component 1 n=1 Tax=Candidatus Methanocrinis natronophilus TaxID=3033396 RepID=A0ABT5X912_9EURY|nr:anthranilate synthase component I [Candidatus Methanocrinis natronophilus]MDF0591148.1 anthranilate synthase component I [Candidatus Methanocrinis natronophilus]